MTTSTISTNTMASSNRSVPTRIHVPSEVQIDTSMIDEETQPSLLLSPDVPREVLPMQMDNDDAQSDNSVTSSSSGIHPIRLEERFTTSHMGNRGSSHNHILPSDDEKVPHRVWQSVKRRLHMINVYIGIDSDEDETYSYLFDDQEHMEENFYLNGHFDGYGDYSYEDDDTVYTASTVASSIQATPSMEDSLCVKNIGKI